MFMSHWKTVFAFLSVPLILSGSLHSQTSQKNRVIVLTDIEADPDDTQSMIRLLLYSNVIDIKGFVATTSIHQKNNVHPESVWRVIRAYGKVRANLMKHEAGFPDADSPLELVKQGIAEYGMHGVGDGKDSQGSEWIIKVLEVNDERPPWISVWGGRYELYQPEYSSLDTSGFTGGVPVKPEPRSIWTNAANRYVPYLYHDYGRSVQTDTVSYASNRATLWRCREDFQNDFAARMDWCTKSYQEANHPPVPALEHPEQITVKSGDPFNLVARRTADPDGDNVSYLWFQYPKAGTCRKFIEFISAENIYKVSVRAPVAEKAERST